MSSRYPILDNKPIDQFKVTELKEELRKRRLAIKGLKDDLIKRLDEAIRAERESDGKDVITGDDLVGEDEAQSEDDQLEGEDGQPEKAQTSEVSPVAVVEVPEVSVNAAAEIENADVKSSAEVTDGEIVGGVVEEGTNSTRVEEELANATRSSNAKPEASDNVASEALLRGKDAEMTETVEMNGDSEPQLNNENLKPELDNEGSKPLLDSEDSKPVLGSEDPKPQLENAGLRSPPEHVMVDSSSPNHQVSEVSLNLGFQVKSDSISTDSVSISEKIEIKDNIISDNVKLELDDVKPEMVEPSTDNHVPIVGESHPMDVEAPQEKMESVEEKDDSNATSADLSKENDILDVGDSEKLNLDRSSGDDSMEEDVVENKQIDSKYNPDGAGDKIEESEMHVVKDEILVDAPGNHLSTDEKQMHVESLTRPSVPSEKRKLNDQEVAGSTEPLKRQRKWNTESLKVPEPQSTTPAPTTTPKDMFSPMLSRRNFSRSDSTVSNEETPKERVVPPSQKPPTNSLRIDRFLRPFTIKAVQELLGKTGTITSFWMDHIKTHCYVSYSSPEEATETRNALYNLQWPSNGGRLLVAEFVDPQEVRNRAEAPPSPAAPLTPGPPIASPVPPQPSPRQQVSRQQLPPPPALPPPPPLSNPPPMRERLVNLPPPPPLEKHDPPIVTLDDLFRKTRATPRIYYLPLTEEQVAAKLERAKSAKSAGVAYTRKLFGACRGMWFDDDRLAFF
ncbi:Apoptotic chromatin condensation inducer in the nucleus [Euphorbia peplus]|nr:Apoptotic chromatin condensation inducer in the nucleus [Euphorbia peplus]